MSGGYRAARSVHLRWTSSRSDEVVALYSEVRVKQTTAGSYFMGAGFNGGYFGIQDLDGRRKRILFSVWDASSEMNQGRDDPTQVHGEDRVQILYEAPHVHVQRFGGEGTGAQCFDDKTGWELDSTMRLCVIHRKEADGHACYAAFAAPQGQNWIHLASYRVRKGKKFEGFYSFVEDFRRDGNSVHYKRVAEYGPVWMYHGCQWAPASGAQFTASGSRQERPDNIDVWNGPENGTMVLATGGSLAGEYKLNKTFRVNPGDKIPALPADPRTVFQKRSDPKKHPQALFPAPGSHCPLCYGPSKSGSFCLGNCCGQAQCQAHDGMPIPGQRCIWKCAGGIFCHYHESDGRKCSLCGRSCAQKGPYCYGDGSACGYVQCQDRSPFLPGRRCDWAIHKGVRCAYHA